MSGWVSELVSEVMVAGVGGGGCVCLHACVCAYVCTRTHMVRIDTGACAHVCKKYCSV